MNRMRKSMLSFGAVCGLLITVPMFLGLARSGSEEAPQFSEWLGYLTMILAFSILFVGIKRFRDQQFAGVIRFGTAFGFGLGITAVASVIYVIGWEITLAATDYAFIDQYTSSVVATQQAEGVSAEELEELVASMEMMKERYSKPFYRFPITFLEIFPVGFLISLISAALLRNPKVLPARNTSTQVASNP